MITQRLVLNGDSVWSCAWCAAELAGEGIAHREDCRWVDEIRAAERKRLLDLDALRAAVQHPAVTGALAMLESQGGGPGDLAFALSEALSDIVPPQEDGTT